MGESAEARSFFCCLGFGVLARVFAEASRFLSVSRFSLCSRGGARGRARAAPSGFGFSGEDMAGAWSSSSGLRSRGVAVGVFEREWVCWSAMMDVRMLTESF